MLNCILPVHVGSVDNPTYEEGFDLTPLAGEVNGERHVQNPIYGDVDAIPTTVTAITNQTYEALYSEATLVNEATYENANDTSPQECMVPETIINKQRQDHSRVNPNGTRVGTITAETKDANYSTLGPTDYFTLQPHIPMPTEQQLPPTNDDYSQLHHL